MSLLDVYADSAGAAYDRKLRDPGPEPDVSFSTTSFLGAGLKAFPAAALDVAGSVSDLLSGAATADAASGYSAGGMFSIPTPKEQKEQEAARQKMLAGEAFDTAGGNAVRRKANEFGTDPLTSHQADQILHGVVRFGGKAFAAVGTMGPVVGPLFLGAEETNTTAQNLISEGVDPQTSAKVGAVQGVISAVGAVLPVAGKTTAQTIGLIGVGGPGSYMAQEQLSRRILENAGYLDQASLHNPFDPLGLALSTIIPGGFGALHLRGEFKRAEGVKAGTVPLAQLRPEELRALKYNDPRLDAYASQVAEANGVPPALLLAIKNAGEKSGPTAVSPAGAQGVMQFMPRTAKEMGLADRTDPLASIEAGARYMKKLYDAYGSWDAAVAHYNGGGAQAALVRSGGAPTAKETIGYLRRVQEYMAQHTAETAAKSPEAVDAARVAALNDTVARSLPDTPDAVAQVQRAADIVGESGGRAAEAEIPPPSIRAYHRTTADFEGEFSNEHPNETGVSFAGKRGFYFSRDVNDPSTQVFGNRVIEADVSVLRPAPVEQLSIGGHETPRTVLQATPDWIEANKVDPREGGLVIAKSLDDARAGSFEPEGSGTFNERLQALEAAANEGRLFRLINPERMHDADVALLEANGYDGFDYVKPEGAKSVMPSQVVALRAEQIRRVGQSAIRPAENFLPPADSVSLAGDQPAKAGAELGAAPAKGGETAAAKPAAQSSGSAPRETAEAPSLDTQLAHKLAAEQPDLRVVLPGSDEHITVAEAMARIAEEQKQDGQWANLVRAAAECALTAG